MPVIARRNLLSVLIFRKLFLFVSYAQSKVFRAKKKKKKSKQKTNLFLNLRKYGKTVTREKVIVCFFFSFVYVAGMSFTKKFCYESQKFPDRGEKRQRCTIRLLVFAIFCFPNVAFFHGNRFDE